MVCVPVCIPCLHPISDGDMLQLIPEIKQVRFRYIFLLCLSKKYIFGLLCCVLWFYNTGLGTLTVLKGAYREYLLLVLLLWLDSITHSLWLLPRGTTWMLGCFNASSWRSCRWKPQSVDNSALWCNYTLHLHPSFDSNCQLPPSLLTQT